MNTEQQKRLAEIVKDKPHSIMEYVISDSDSRFEVVDENRMPWKPSIEPDAEDWQRSQALSVIVCALNISIEVSNRKTGYRFLVRDSKYDLTCSAMPLGKDILEAASLAILEAQC